MDLFERFEEFVKLRRWRARNNGANRGELLRRNSVGIENSQQQLQKRRVKFLVFSAAPCLRSAHSKSSDLLIRWPLRGMYNIYNVLFLKGAIETSNKIIKYVNNVTVVNPHRLRVNAMLHRS